MASEVQSQTVATLLRMVVCMRGPNGGGVAGILRMGAYPHQLWDVEERYPQRGLERSPDCSKILHYFYHPQFYFNKIVLILYYRNPLHNDVQSV